MKELYSYAVKEKNENSEFVESVFYNWDTLKVDSDLVKKIREVDVGEILKQEAKSI